MLTFEKTETPFYSEAIVCYEPNFVRIFIDLNRKIETEDCETIIGQFGFDSEFFFNRKELSKISIEFSDQSHIFTLNKNTSLDILELIRTEATPSILNYRTLPLKEKDKPILESTFFSGDFNFCVFFYDRLQEDLTEDVFISNEIQFVKISSKVILGLTKESAELYCILVNDFMNNLAFEDLIISEAEFGTERFLSLQNILRSTIEISMSEKEYNRILENHISRFDCNELVAKYNRAETRIIESAKSRFKFGKLS